MKLMLIVLGFSFVAHVKCQPNPHIDELLYEEDEEYDEEGASTTTTTTTTLATTTSTRPPTTVAPAAALALGNGTHFPNGTLVNGTEPRANQTFVLQSTNGSSIFTGAIQSIIQTNGATTERVHYVLSQVGGIFNNVGTLNITGIVDQALGIRNSQFARPLVTGILNAVLCNPITFSVNNCQKTT